MRARWIVLAVALYVGLVVAIVVDWMWLAFLLVMPLVYVMGRFDWFKYGRHRVEVMVERRYRAQIRDLCLRLARVERALADRGESDHAWVRGDAWPSNSNGAGHYSPGFTDDSPARRDVGSSNQGVVL